MSKELQIVSYEQARRLRELGFDWKVNHWYNSDKSLSNSLNYDDRNDWGLSTSAPYIALALKWCRDEKNLFGSVWKVLGNYKASYVPVNEDLRFVDLKEDFDSYEVAESSLLDEILKI